MQQPITIYFATDHAGFALKNELLVFVRDELKYNVVDCGADIYDENDDFTTYIAKAAREVSANSSGAKAIILGGSGQGEAMLANRFHDVRAVVYYGGDEEIIRLSRIHNDANVLSLGARFIDKTLAQKMIALWLDTDHAFIEKYDRRNKAIDTVSRGHKHTSVKVKRSTGTQKFSVVPSLPAKSFSEIRKLTDTLVGVVSEIQIDIVDGFFVPHISWPFTELDVARELLVLQDIAKSFALEIDCMCMHPQQYLDTFVKVGASRVIIHVGTTGHIHECIVHAKKHGYKIGLGILNSTPHEKLEEYADDIDFVQVMGIERIGIQGQLFDTRTLQTIASIKQMYPHLEIAVDGAVNADTIVQLLEAGATRFASGSAITQSSDPVTSYKQLARMVGL